jgi:hypothetical protein
MARVAQAIGSAVRGVFRCLYDTYRLGGQAFLVAPALVALAVIPEFVQHVVEIRIGMFDSVDAARALSGDSLRWGFGYAKLVGFGLAILLTARLWACDGAVRRTVLVPPRALLHTVFAIALVVGSGAGLDWVARQLPGAGGIAIDIAGAIVQAGLVIWAVAALFEDRSVSLRQALTTRLPTGALLLLLFFAAMLPAQLVHQFNHKLALGQPDALVWGLMLFDSLVVGLMAALAGAAIFVGFRAGPSWRGWTRTPGSRA